MAWKGRQEWSITKVAPTKFVVRTYVETEESITSAKVVVSTLSAARRLVTRWEKEQDA